MWARIYFASGQEDRVSERGMGGKEKRERQATCGGIRLPVVQSDESSTEHERTENRERFRLLLNQGEHLGKVPSPRPCDGSLCLLFSIRRPAGRRLDLDIDQSAKHDLTELFESGRAEVIGRVEFCVDEGRNGEEELDRVRDGGRGGGVQWRWQWR